MPQWLSQLGARVPQIALGVLAAKRGGPDAAAAFMGGLQEAQMRKQALARQAQMDDEARQYRAQQLALQQRQMEGLDQRAAVDDQRLASAEARQAQAEAVRRAQAAVEFLAGRADVLGKTADDPLAAEQDFSRQAVLQEQIAGMAPGSLMALTPSFSSGISRRKAEAARVWAKGIVEDARDASAKLNQPLTDESVSMAWDQVPEPVQALALAHGHPQGQPFKLSRFEELAQLPSFRMTTKAQDPATVERAILLADQRGDQAEVARLLELDRKMKEAARAPKDAPDVTDLSPQGLDMAALMYRKTGALPPLGMGDRVTRKRILDRAASLTQDDVARIEAGPADIASNQANYRADRASLAALQRSRDAITSFEQTASKNIDIFLAQAGKIVDAGSPLANRVARSVGGELLGSPNVAAYNAARQVAINEVAKITSNPNMSGVLSDTARREVEAFNPNSATLAQTVAVMRVLRQEMANRTKALDSTLADIRGRISGQSVAPVQRWGRDANGKPVRVP